MTNFLSQLESTGTTLAGNVGTAAVWALAIAVAFFGIRLVWSVFKKIR